MKRMWLESEAMLSTLVWPQPDCCWVPISHCLLKEKRGRGPVYPCSAAVLAGHAPLTVLFPAPPLSLPIRARLPPHGPFSPVRSPSSLAHLFQSPSQRIRDLILTWLNCVLVLGRPRWTDFGQVVELTITKWSLIVINNCSTAWCSRMALEWVCPLWIPFF